MTFSLEKNDKRAYWLIGIFTVVVFALVSVLTKVQLNVNPGFDVHIFAKINAVINTIVAILWWQGYLQPGSVFTPSIETSCFPLWCCRSCFC